MNTLNLLVPVLAGLIGGVAGIFLGGRITRDVKIILAFSGSYLFALTVLHLFPQVYHEGGSNVGIFILLGFLTQIVLDFFSKGVEHGHIHKSDQLAKSFPLGIFLALFIHSFIEGLPLTDHAGHEHHGHLHFSSNELLAGIAIHKIPEAISLAALIYHHYNSSAKTLLVIALYCTATPLGILAGSFLTSGNFENPELIYNRALAFAIGIFIHVSTTIIFEAEEHHKLNWRKVIAILAGLGLVLFL
jgi:zinc transporter ZupT